MHPNAIIHNVEQGSPEWHQSRNGLLTASEVKLILTPKLKIADNEKTRMHVYELAGQRIAKYTEPTYVGSDMLRGHVDEIKARDLYNDHYAPVEEIGFITRDIGGCVIGYSPDGVGVMDPFGIECKSRRQKYQIQVVTSDKIDDDHILQVQSGLLVTGWTHIDYLSYCGGLPLWRIRSEPIAEYQEAITDAAIKFEKQVQDVVDKYMEKIGGLDKVINTEREQPETEVYFDG